MKHAKDIVLRLLELTAFAVMILTLYFVESSIRNFSELNYSLKPLICFAIVYPLFFGALIRLSDLVKRKGSQNRFDWIRFLIVVLPGVIIIAQTLIAVVFETNIWFGFMLLSYNVTRPLIGIWVGANLIDCIKKSDNNFCK